ncbi:YaiI/YqxD family protein [Texcoconibacillus texcoconensis]|uniref:UPF0178 protein HNQ41_002116 n=1 Tax=Texcoconibacillus texcoconensis TaxID=1095777 RepID=A0A840QR40_9BACI|nr:YaiI/YqxD family protein [Texcoconibacillus texcoconensis]MBB5173926.1 hypothetical protein [Texcoconibacillus texcoconensis]
METINSTIYVDADACPVKEEIKEAGERFDTDVIMVSSYAHAGGDDGSCRWIMVDQHQEEADMKIFQLAKKNDIVVTQDYGLASLLLPKGVIVLSFRGFIFSEQSMDDLLFRRYISSKERREGKRTKGPKRLMADDRTAFRINLEKILSNKQDFC